MGLVHYDEAWGSQENLRLSLIEVDLAHSTLEKLVLTSDHGNMVGKQTWPVSIKPYRHPIDS